VIDFLSELNDLPPSAGATPLVLMGVVSVNTPLTEVLV
jgi:hypothetical protein